MNLKPLESVAKYRQPLPLLSPLSLNVDTGNDPNSPSSILGRTLKRKFTELEEITQRLKARLFDVTGDENFDPDDEFERDLNTTVDEMEDDEFEWLKGGQNGLGFNEHANHFQSVLTTNPINSVNSSQPQPSTSSQCHELPLQTRAVSGCSQQQQNELLKYAQSLVFPCSSLCMSEKCSNEKKVCALLRREGTVMSCGWLSPFSPRAKTG